MSRKRQSRWVFFVLGQVVADFLLLCVRLYQRLLRPLLGPRCRFYPSCSEYAALCLTRYKVHYALYKITKRLLSCHPMNRGGVDEP